MDGAGVAGAVFRDTG